MNNFAHRVHRIRGYWGDAFGNETPAFHSCVALSVTVLAVLYVVALPWMVLASVAGSFRK